MTPCGMRSLSWLKYSATLDGVKAEIDAWIEENEVAG
jgi:hypothetical protein